MRIELVVNEIGLPQNGFSKIETQTHRILQDHYPQAHIYVRKGHNNNLNISGMSKPEKSEVRGLLEEMFNDADAWLYEEDL